MWTVPGCARTEYRPSASVRAERMSLRYMLSNAVAGHGDAGDALAGPGVDDPAGDGHQPLERDLDRGDAIRADLDVLDRLSR